MILMTEKRYFMKRWEGEYYIFDSNTISESDFEEKLEYQDYRAFEDSMTGEEIVDLLNELSDEKEDLKIFLKAVNEELSLANRDCDILEEENEQLKQFKEKVFTWIDKEIARNEESIEWGKESGADIGAIGFYNHMLKRLKKELSE